MKNYVILSLIIIASMWQLSTALPLDSSGGNKILWTQNFEGNVYYCAFMPDENFIIVAHDSILEVRRTIDQSLVRSTVIKEGIIYSLDVSKDGKYVVIGGPFLKILDINTFELIKDYKKGWANSVCFSPDGSMLGFIGYDSKSSEYANLSNAIIIDVETGKQRFRFGMPDTTPKYTLGPLVQFVKFSPDGKYFAINSLGNLHIYNFF